MSVNLFEVISLKTGRKVSVYGVSSTSAIQIDKAYFLICDKGVWGWEDASNYKPVPMYEEERYI